MRLSNGVAHLENSLTKLGKKIKRAASDAAFTLKCKRENLRLELMAYQSDDLAQKLARLAPVDKAEVELRAMDIAAIRDAAAIRKQEHKLRRDYAQLVLDGVVPLDIIQHGALYLCDPPKQD